MLRNFLLFIVSGFLMLNLCGCFAVVAGVAGGAGTAVWLSGKMTEQFNAPFDRTIDATRVALKSMNLPETRETQDADTAQIKSVYTDQREIWIDIHRAAPGTTKVEVRVGSVNPDKDAASQILSAIQAHL